MKDPLSTIMEETPATIHTLHITHLETEVAYAEPPPMNDPPHATHHLHYRRLLVAGMIAVATVVLIAVTATSTGSGQNNAQRRSASASLAMNNAIGNCGCATTCTFDVLSQLATDAAGAYACRDRMVYMQTIKGLTPKNACAFVAHEFPTLCGPCACTATTNNNTNNNNNNTSLVTGFQWTNSTNTADPNVCPVLQWSDEFDGTTLNLNHWEYQIGDGCDAGLCGWGNNELQSYHPTNVLVSGGMLSITAKQELSGASHYTSGRIRTRGLYDVKYGYMEARIQIPSGPGMWPAFWMLSTNETYGICKCIFVLCKTKRTILLLLLLLLLLLFAETIARVCSLDSF
jgi:hypothetical protein